MPCPKCGNELRAIKSLGINLCDGCGYREDLPIATSPAPKKKKVNFLPLALMLGIGGLGITAIAASALHQRSIKLAEIAEQKEFDAKVREAEAAIAEIKANTIDINDLPDFCQPTKYQQLNYEMYLHCFPEKMTYSQVNQITGMPGEIVSNSGGTKVMQFIGRGDYSGYGYMAVVFQGDRLVSKSQTNLIRH